MSQCVGRCDEGYEEVTPVITECTDQGAWSNPPLICRGTRLRFDSEIF